MSTGAGDPMRDAVVAHGRGDFATAERLYRQVLARRGATFEPLHNLGHVLVQQGRPREAVAWFERALTVRPQAPQTHNMLAQTLGRLRRYDEAIAAYRRALELRPNYAQAQHDLGRLLHALGRREEALAALEAAVDLAPASGEFHRSLSEIVRFTPDHPRLHAMEALARGAAALGVADRIELHYALGKAYDDLERPDAAFAQYAAGAALVRRHVAYDERAAIALFDRMRAVFTPELIRTRSGQGDPSAAPIFILGMPRSGSTLVEQVLASHPDVVGGGELTAFRDIAAAALGEPEALATLPEAALRAIGTRYLDAVAADHPGAARVTDKMPANFLLAGLIHLALPRARIIHTVRDPVDTCLSGFKTLFADGHAYSYELGELGRHYRAYDGLMAHWRAVLPPGVMLEVAYEQVVDDLEGQARRILDHCGLDWDGACLDFHRTPRAVWTASLGQVRQPLYRSSVGRGRPASQALAPLIAGLGPPA